MSQEAVEAGRRAHERYHFYVTALTFTILGLAIQTTRLGTFLSSTIVELVGWGFLLASGLPGLYLLKDMPRGYFIDEQPARREWQCVHKVLEWIQAAGLISGILALAVARALLHLLGTADAPM